MAMPSSIFHDDDAVVDRNRIMRERARWRGLEELTALARIEVLEHGGISRPIVTRGGKHLRSRLISRKTKRVQITEGKGLRFLCRMCEVDCSIIDYQAHPFRVTAVVDGESIQWYPDLVYILSDGSIEIIEVKRTTKDLEKDEIRFKLDAFREIFRRCGWKMCIRYNKDIFGSDEVRGCRASNVGAVYARRFLTLEHREVALIAQLIHAGSPIQWSEASRFLSPDDQHRGDALIEAAIAHGSLSVDFDAPFAASTLLKPVAAPGELGTFRI